tara:strand:+ start:524 stop:721 length:198 start_codon:yes stop_codon:yes gene_type:complete
MKNTEMKTKRLNLKAFHAYADETYLTGTDENGQEIQIIMNTIEVLEYIDKEYLKETLITKYIKNL